MISGAYRALTDIAGVFLPRWLDSRAIRGKEDPHRLAERRGAASQPRPPGRLVWFHAASVGESLSILPLIEAVLAQGWGVVVTTGTVTSARLLAERLPKLAIHQYAPLDHRPWVHRFLDYWRPDLALWTESELWPNMLGELAARRIPAVLVNARLSSGAFKGWRFFPGFARQILAAFAQVIAQSDSDRTRFASLGARQVSVAGNLKLTAAPLPVDATALDILRAQVGKRPHWLAASIHPGEDIFVATAHQTAQQRHPGLLTFVVPRHPQKASDMAAVFRAMGLKVARRSIGEAVTPSTDIYLGDTMGELGLFYRLCSLTFMGKSLTVGGGQNPAEAAQLGCALLLGPNMSNFQDIAQDLIDRRGAIEVLDATALAAAVDWLLQDSRTRARMGEAARNAIARHADAISETLALLAPYLENAQIR